MSRSFAAQSLRVMPVLIVACWLGLMSGLLQAKEPIVVEDDLFKLMLPDGWSVYNQQGPIQVKGPNGQLMTIMAMQPEQTPYQGQPDRLMEKYKAGLQQSFELAAAQTKSVIVSPFQEVDLATNGRTVRLHSRQLIDNDFLLQYAVVNPTRMLFLSVEGKRSNEANSMIVTEEMLRNLQWVAVY